MICIYWPNTSSGVAPMVVVLELELELELAFMGLGGETYPRCQVLRATPATDYCERVRTCVCVRCAVWTCVYACVRKN